MNHILNVSLSINVYVTKYNLEQNKKGFSRYFIFVHIFAV